MILNYEYYKEIILFAIQKFRSTVIQYTRSNKILDDYEIIMKIVKYEGGLIRHASPRLKANRDIVMAAVKSNGNALAFTSYFHDDKEIAMIAVNTNGNAINYISKELKTRDLVMAAVKNNGKTLEYVSEYNNDQDVVIAAVNNDGEALQFASINLKAKKRCSYEGSK